MVLIPIQCSCVNQFDYKNLTPMVKLTTKISFDVKLDSERVQKTTKTVSRVLRVVKETIRSHVRKKT